MKSYRDKSGSAFIQWTLDGKRRTIRLGEMNDRLVDEFVGRMRAMLDDRRLNRRHDAELLEWLNRLPAAMHERLARADLTLPRIGGSAPTLGELVERFVQNATCKPQSMAAYRQGLGSLVKFLGADRRLAEITIEDGDRWRKSMLDDGKGYSVATVSKRIGTAKLLFRRAVRWRMLERSPFIDLKPGPQTNADRQVHVSREMAMKVLAACEDDSWRALVALSRFAGLRVPSETRLLRWSDVNWQKRRLTVRSPKTAGHDGHAMRVVPIDPTLLVILQRLHAAAPAGAVEVFPGQKAGTSYLWRQFFTMISRAGVTPWPRLFHNMRASAGTDWADRFPVHTVAK